MWCGKCAAFQSANNAECERCGAPTGVAPAKKRHLLRNFILIILAPFVLLFVSYGVHEALLTPAERAKEQADIEAKHIADNKAKAEADAKSVADAKAAAEAPAPVTAEEARDSVLIPIAARGAEALKESMRNPDSFKLSSAFFMPNNAVCYQYRAQNGFGGMNVEEAVLTPKNALRNDRASWARYCAGRKGKNRTWDVNYAAGWASLWSK